MSVTTADWLLQVRVVEEEHNHNADNLEWRVVEKGQYRPLARRRDGLRARFPENTYRIIWGHGHDDS